MVISKTVMDNNLFFLAYLLSLQDNQGGGIDRKGCLQALGFTVLLLAVVTLIVCLLVNW